MDKKYENLRSKTIFDFTNDEKVLKKVFEEMFFDDYRKNPVEFVNDYIESWTEYAKMFDIVLYSAHTNNKELYDLMKSEFFDEYPKLFDFEF